MSDEWRAKRPSPEVSVKALLGEKDRNGGEQERFDGMALAEHGERAVEKILQD